MDHLMLKGPIPELRVPFFDGPECRGPDFWRFPQRVGWDFAFLRGEFRGKTFRDVQALIQSWLYFGFLRTYTGVDFDDTIFLAAQAEHIGHEDDGKWLTSTPLPDIIDTFRKKILRLSGQEKRERGEELHAGILNFRMVLDLVEQLLETDGLALLASLLVLSHHLKGTSATLFEEYDWAWHEREYGGDLNEKLFGACFTARQWCPRASKIAFSCLPANALLYLLSCGDFSTVRKHDACTEDTCNALQTTGQQVGGHTIRDCSCDLVRPDISSLCKIIQDNKVPILALSQSFDGSLAVTVKAWEPGDRYCAISHVWADSLASANDNAIQVCQLQRIKELANGRMKYLARGDLALVGASAIERSLRHDPEDGPSPRVNKQFNEQYFWMDSLCIPSDPKFEELRNTSVAGMREIYRNATSVLVLDGDMLGLAAESPPQEIALRLLLSGWAQRLWTLQEGALSPDVFIGLNRDVAYHIDIVLGKLLREAFDQRVQRAQSYRSIALEAHHHVKLFLQYAGSRENANHSFAAACMAFRYRATSRSEDEAVCIASFFGLDVKRILAVSSSEQDSALKRMRTLVEMITPVPEDLLFATGPRLPFDGLRWAPRTLLAPYGLVEGPIGTSSQLQSNQSQMHQTETILNSDGLYISLPSFQLSLGPLSMNGSVARVTLNTKDMLHLRIRTNNAIQDLERELLRLANDERLFLLYPRRRLETAFCGVLVSKVQSYESYWRVQYRWEVRITVLKGIDSHSPDQIGKATVLQSVSRWWID